MTLVHRSLNQSESLFHIFQPGSFASVSIWTSEIERKKNHEFKSLSKPGLILSSSERLGKVVENADTLLVYNIAVRRNSLVSMKYPWFASILEMKFRSV